MRFRTTAILLGVLVLVGGYVLVFERGEPEGSGDVLRPMLLGFDAPEAREVCTEHPGTGERTELVFRTEENAWYVSHPREEPADAAQVKRLLETLAGLQSVRELTGTLEGLASYGLSPPEMQVQVILTDGRELDLHIGLETVTGGGYYAKVADQYAVHVIPSYAAQDVQDLILSPPYRPTPTPEPTAGSTSEAPAS